MKTIKRTLAAALLLSSPLAMADSAGAMFSSVDGFNAPAKSSVSGVRLAMLHGEVSELKGVDFSILGMSETNTTTGLNFGLFFGASKVNTSMTGASLGLFNWNTGQTNGLNFGLVNMTNNVKGLNFGTINYSEGNTLVDFGLGNISQESTVQFGFFNMTKKIDGVQIGLLNCADNGFLKCFPIINFPL
ncbi:phaC PHA synthase [Vibrio sp. SS-MA-C1-2]|uniref:VC2662 family protein n=1 Tax=Vibrio sp. SS-MA-C1-2 TaxID=2908646 RepID=UPI001F318202|nr:phaC PHA synthase [Vibrio sp. SS-MA-C1-2]UJF18874.1 phaC PHA synthase [Vibrio sp. SS-MA-C1-2]